MCVTLHMELLVLMGKFAEDNPSILLSQINSFGRDFFTILIIKNIFF